MIEGIIFDKDGTLFDFNATWGVWSLGLIQNEAKGDAQIAARLADVLGYDVENKRFRPGSVVIADTVQVVAEAILTVIDDDKARLIARMNTAAAAVPQVQAAPLPALFDMLARSYRLGLATNDAESSARRHLAQVGISQHFDFIAGYDSGYGGKPAPGQLLAFCQGLELEPEACVMVGDSRHDLEAGRAAGMWTVGVLTGPAEADELAPLADLILPDIAALPARLPELVN